MTLSGALQIFDKIEKLITEQMKLKKQLVIEMRTVKDNQMFRYMTATENIIEREEEIRKDYEIDDSFLFYKEEL